MSDFFSSKSRRKRWKWIIATACVLVFVIYFIYAPIVGAIIGRKLHLAIETRLHAVLRYDSLTYSFPLQVCIVNARLVGDDSIGGDALLTVDRLDVELAKVPLPGRPLVIKSFDVQGPVVRVERTSHGITTVKDLKRSDAELRGHPPTRRLSEMFELRKFAITDGKVMYEDRTIAGAEPLIFRGITVDLGITPQSNATYAYQFKTRQPPDVDLAAEGTVDVDAATLNFTKLTISAQAQRSDGESAMPPQVQKIFNELGITGQIDVSGSGQVPLRDPGSSGLTSDITIRNVRVKLPDQQGNLDGLDAQIHADVQDGQTQIQLQQFTARSGAARITAQQATAQLNAGKWKLTNLTGKIEATAPGPTTEPGMIERTAVLGGSADFTADASGDYQSPAKYSVAVHPVGFSLLPRGFSQPVQNLTCNMQITESSIRFWNLYCDLLGGHMTAGGTIKLDTPPSYEMDFNAQLIDLAQLSSMPIWQGKFMSLTGAGDLNAKLQGKLFRDSTRMLDSLVASGESDIAGTRLLESHVLTSIADTIDISRDSLTTGDGAAVFSIADRTLTFQHAAINTKLLGLQGKGTIGFDRLANLDIVAAPLGNWRSHIQSMQIPIVGNVAGQFVGGVQKMVNKSSNLLYEFHVTGQLPDAQIKTIPAPVLTDGAAKVFGGMMQNIKNSDLLKAIKEAE